MPRTYALLLLLLLASYGVAEEPAKKEAEANEPDAKEAVTDPVEQGHSLHGDFYNEGPRQHAYLMGGTGQVTFAVTSKVDQVEEFVQQGLGQVYGFWYLEAERSFRHAAWLDPDCAIAYWGAALATAGNASRSKGFIAEAVKRKDKCSERERMYIESLDAYLKADKAKADERDETYRKALEDIVLKFPDALDAKALLALQLYKNRKNGNYLATEAFFQQIISEVPQHSTHHFRIHLWDHRKPEMALTSAANCGQGSPSIAHMWHMPGHIYSRLKRYDDACWQQEASARVDHYHMIHDRLLPDQIHNYAHNNEWLIRNLNFVGRVRHAVDLAKNMIELPRHPKYNTLKRGSSQYGRRRLIDTLEQYELWEEAVALCNSSYLEPTDDDSQQVKRIRLLGTAHARLGHVAETEKLRDSLNERREVASKDRDEATAKAKAEQIEELLKKEEKKLAEATAAAEKRVSEEHKGNDSEESKAELKKKIEQAVAAATSKFRDDLVKREKKIIEKATKDAARPFDTDIKETEKAVAALEGAIALANDDFKLAHERLTKAGGTDPMLLTKLLYRLDKKEEALKAARKHVASHKNEVHPQAELVDLLWMADDREEARKEFEKLREMSASIDLHSPVFQRLTPIAKELGFEADWRVAATPATDVGDRPELDTLGPFRWKPSPAPTWNLPNAKGETVSLKQFSGKPVVLIFYLGHGCLHCAEQLHKFAPQMEAFQKAGIELMAISSDDVSGLTKSIEDYHGEPLPIPLASDADHSVFKKYRAYDDFEQQPLHGTFLIDGAGDIRWQDISYEPFMDPTFVLTEAQRLLGQQKLASPRPTKPA